MRVLLTTDTVGGVWTFSHELASGLLSRGHAVSLVALGRTTSPGQEAVCASLAAAYPDRFASTSSAVPLEWMDGNQSAYQDGAEIILRAAEAFQPDLLHSSQFCYGALSTACPRLITAHSDVLSWAEACRPQGFAPSAWLDTYVGLVEAGLRGAEAVVAPTHWMARALARHFPDLPRYRHVIANGRSLVTPTKRPRKLQAVSVGRLWDEGKNVRLLAEIRSSWPLLVAGDQTFGSGEARNSLGEVQMLRPLGGEALLALFCESSAYICTSLYEPFGLAPLEAALCGCALLLHDLPSLRELWGDAALYFRNAAELSALLQRLERSPERLRATQQSAQERARHFNAERMIESYLALYEELLASTEDDVRELARDAA